MNLIPEQISVGILSSKEITFRLKGQYQLLDNLFEGELSVSVCEGKVKFLGRLYEELVFSPLCYNKSFFELKEVIIGIGFHWQKKELQRFRGCLKFMVEDDLITAINILPIEDYLTSVISSEMSATSYMELLKAHAVISRSWLLSQMVGHVDCQTSEMPMALDADVLFVNRWYERDKHKNYDVCADDHCQRYQGITKVTTSEAKAAVEATRGDVLVSEGEICDARFSKSCGGATERFDTCWADKHYEYLECVPDNPEEELTLDLTTEADAKKWIMSSPDSFCNVTDEQVLRQVLNNFDQSTTDFFRWKVVYSEQQLADMLKRRSGIDFGMILDIVPLKRGRSGRISYLQIVGTKSVVVVGKELEIRKWLSETHLYSSAFVVEKEASNFVFYGAGWGHGVGLCQIGAALMSQKGYDYRQILAHYYKKSEIKKIY